MLKKSHQILVAQWLSVVAVFAMVLTSICYLNPWWGLMDDAHLLQMCLSPKGFYNDAIGFVTGDLSWGMIRPFYPIMTYFLYCITFPNPVMMYVLNFIFVTGLLLYLAKGLRDLVAEEILVDRSFLPLFLLSVLGVFRFHDIFMHPSLQEKLVLLAFLFNLQFYLRAHKQKSLNIASQSLMALLLIAGLLTKAQFIVFIPAISILVFQLCQKRKLGMTPLALFLILEIVGALGLLWIAKTGGYTRNYGADRMLSTLLSRESMVLLFTAAISLSSELFFYVHSRKREKLNSLLNTTIPALILVSYVIVFLPWGIGDGYLLVLVIPFFVMCWLVLFYRVVKKGWLQNAVILSICLLAIAVTGFRSYRNFSRLADLRVNLDALAAIPGPNFPIISMPCMEGADSVRFYLNRLKHKEFQVDFRPDIQKATSGIILVDSSLCKGQISEKFKLKTKPGFAGSFRLYEAE